MDNSHLSGVLSTPNLGVFDEKICTHVYTALIHLVRLVTMADMPCVLGKCHCVYDPSHLQIESTSWRLVMLPCEASRVARVRNLASGSKDPTREQPIGLLVN